MEASDADAVARVLAGDQDAFRVLVERHSRRVFRLAYRMTSNEHDAEDVVQETFLRAYRRLSQFESRSNFGTWLYRVAVNCALDLVRRKGRHNQQLPTVPLDEPVEREGAGAILSLPASNPTPERLALSAELRQRLHAALAGLSDRERAAFVLRHFEGVSIPEIGRVLGLRASATKNTVFRAVQKLRRALEPPAEFSI
jgi:RNA polymerase sigma-70 factor (ECF subfamily)